MATAGPSRKSYAEAVKTAPPLRPEPARYFKNAPGNEDEWTDVSSMTSCSWPSFVDDLDASESLGHSRNGHKAEQDFQNGYDPSVFDNDVLCESEDTRAERALAGFVSYTSRERRLYDRLGVCSVSGKPEKPWKPFPGCHDECLGAKVWSRRGRWIMRKKERGYNKREAREAQGS